MKGNLLQNLIIEKARPLDWYLKSVIEHLLFFFNQSDAISPAPLSFVLAVSGLTHTWLCPCCGAYRGRTLSHHAHSAHTHLSTWVWCMSQIFVASGIPNGIPPGSHSVHDDLIHLLMPDEHSVTALQTLS